MSAESGDPATNRRFFSCRAPPLGPLRRHKTTCSPIPATQRRTRYSHVYATLRFFTQTIRAKTLHARIQALGRQRRKRCAPALRIAGLLGTAEKSSAQSAALRSGVGGTHDWGKPFENAAHSHEPRCARCGRCRSATFSTRSRMPDRIIISRANPILARPEANVHPSPECYRKRMMQRVSPVQFRLFKLLLALSPPCPSFPTLRRSRRP
jgi:hypothetical protein